MDIFTDVLRALGRLGTGLIEQASDGLLLLGPQGEKLVEHYGFYAVFMTPQEFRLVADGKQLGTLPINNVLAPGALLIFSGRRWRVQEIHDAEKVIILSPAKAGTVPRFNGEIGALHDRVIERMFEIYECDSKPVYMDQIALELLKEARGNYAQFGFSNSPIVQTGEDSYILATRCGTEKNNTLMLALRTLNFSVQPHDGFVEVSGGNMPLRQAIQDFAGGKTVNLFSNSSNLIFEKFHPYLTSELLQKDALSNRLDPGSLGQVSNALLHNHA